MTFKTHLFLFTLLVASTQVNAGENIRKKKWLTDVEVKKSVDLEATKNNFEIKKFTSAELDEAALKKSFYAFRVDNRNPASPEEDKLTEGDALCRYLGQDKALKSIISAEIAATEANKNGLIIGTGFFGDKKPKIYESEDKNFTVRKYLEITCAKLKSKEVIGAKEELNKAIEFLIVLN